MDDNAHSCLCLDINSISNYRDDCDHFNPSAECVAALSSCDDDCALSMDLKLSEIHNADPRHALVYIHVLAAAVWPSRPSFSHA
jgi:hypothetical protein